MAGEKVQENVHSGAEYRKSGYFHKWEVLTLRREGFEYFGADQIPKWWQIGTGLENAQIRLESR